MTDIEQEAMRWLAGELRWEHGLRKLQTARRGTTVTVHPRRRIDINRVA